MQGMQVQSLVRELRFHMPCSQKAKTENESNIATGSMKTLKIVHIKQIFLNLKNGGYNSSLPRPPTLSG